jgi:conjugal transfer/type IV secretion protein DotA/TraY
MNKYFKLFVTVLFLFSFSTSALADDECALIADASASSGYTVDKDSFEICKQDLSFTVFYLLFGDSLSSPAVEPFIAALVTIPESTKNLNLAAGLGVQIKGVYETLSTLIFTIGTIMILFQTGRYLHKAQSSGEFMGQRRGKVASVAIQGLITIFLITPLGSVMVIQVIVFLMAIIGIMLANFFTGGFLSTVEVKSTKVEIDDNTLFHTSDAYAKALTSHKMCEKRTAKLILNNNLSSTSQWVTEEPDFLSDFTNNSIEEFHQIADACLSYSKTMKASAEQRSQTNVILNQVIDNISCDYSSDNTIERYTSDFGAPNGCGTISYAWSDITSLKTDAFWDTDDDDRIDEMEDIIADSSYQESWSAKNYYPSFVAANISAVRAIVISNASGKEKNKQLKAVYDDQIAKYITIIEGETQLGNVIDTIEDNKLKSQMINAKHLAINNFLLGSVQHSNGADTNISQTTTSEHYLHGEDPDFLGVDALYKSADIAAQYIESAHCAYNWGDPDMTRSRKTLAQYESFDSSDKLADFLDSAGNFSFECMDYKGEREGAKFTYISNSNAETAKAMSNIVITGSGENVAVVPRHVKGSPEYNAIRKAMQDTYGKDNIQNAMVEMSLLSGYYYSVKKALGLSLSKDLKTLTDNSVMIETRQKGWAALGSMMLTISQEMVNAGHFISTVLGSGSAASVGNSSGNTIDFVNQEALNVSSEETTDSSSDAKLKRMSMTNIFNGIGGGHISDANDHNTSAEENESELVEQLLDYVVDTIFSSVKYIKMASNMDEDKGLLGGLKECGKKNDCISTDTHPLNAIMMFGHSMIETMINIMIIKTAADFITKLELGASKNGTEEGGSAKKLIMKIGVWVGGGLINFLIGFVKVLATIVSVVFKHLMPLLSLLLLIGILCGYMLPLMPFLIFTMVFIGWLISIFVISIAAPLWVIMLGNIQEDGNTQMSVKHLWSVTGSVLVKPPLITIAVIFAWTLSSISLFFVNSTIYGVIAATMSDAGIISKLVTYSLSYVMYITVIYLVIYHSFQMIGKFSDEVSDLMQVKRAGDNEMIQNLGIEKLLAGGAIHKQINDLGFKELTQKDKGSQDSRSGQEKATDKLADMVNSRKGSSGRIDTKK